MNFFLAAPQIYSTFAYLDVRSGYLFLNLKDTPSDHINKKEYTLDLTLIPSTCIILEAKFVNYKFIETIFPRLQSSSTLPPLTFTAPEILTFNIDPPTSLPNTKVAKLLHLKIITENIRDGFSSGSRIIGNHLPGT